MDVVDLSINSLKIFLLFFSIVNVVPIMSWIERRMAGLIQDRPGPNRVGPLGLLQPIADVIKFFWKLDPIPDNANKVLFQLAPLLSLLPATLVIAVIPFGDHMVVNGKTYLLQISNLHVGILFLLGVGSLGAYGILFGGWASNNKYSLIGSLRSASQMISYEIPLGLAATGAVLFYGTFSLRTMVQIQDGTMMGLLPRWGIFFQPLGFLIFFITSLAETNRLPFDLPETEGELVAGYHTEYGSMKFALFMMAEYMNLATMSAVMTTLYFGGWHLPWVSDAALLNWLGESRNLLALVQLGVFFVKVYAFLLVYVWIRWTLPRFRFDQLLRLAWRNLTPLALGNIVVTAVLLYFWEHR